MNQVARDSLILKAAVEFGPECTYTIKTGGLGLTLVAHAETRETATATRLKIPTEWEGLYTVVTYYNDPDGFEEGLYDPNLT